MAKYKVNCYYTYVGSVIVEADSAEDAYNKGLELCEDMHTDELDFVGYSDSIVYPIKEDGKIDYGNEFQFDN